MIALTDLEVITTNKRIAEFMKIKFDENWGGYLYNMDTPFLKNHLVQEYGIMWGDIDNRDKELFGYVFFPNSLEYHTSWDWLIPVIERISCADIDYFTKTFNNIEFNLEFWYYGVYNFLIKKN